MKKTITIITVLLFTISAKAQSQTPAKDVFFELGGPGIASFNYDMRFTKSESGIGGRVGIGGFSIKVNNEKTSATFIPIGLNYLLGKDGRNYFEVGGGVSIVNTKSTNTGSSDDKFSSTFGFANFGYRLQPKDGGFFFRAAINPVFGKGYFIPYYAGIAFGYKF